MRTQGRRMRRSLELTVGILLATLAVGVRSARAQGDPTFAIREAQNFAEAQGRTIDQMTNPVYLTLRSSDAQTYAGQQLFGDRGLSYVGDPLRRFESWDRHRGHAIGIAYRNRYGATIRGYLWGPNLPLTDPVTGAATNGPFPAVVLVNGLGSPTQLYLAEAEGLAEAGYVVMQFDPQGVGASDTAPDTAFCNPGSWQQPQEMGFQEQGSCAGENASAENPVSDVQSLVAAKQGGTVDGTEAQYKFGSNYALGALDAVAWLLSDQNPWHSLIDPTRIAIAGHSIGGFTALMAGNGDPLHRLLTAVSWDSYGKVTGPVTPTVSTLIEQSEQEELAGPHVTPPDPQGLHPTRATYAALKAACLPSGFLVLRSSTHNEWAYLGPEGAPTPQASRVGERVSLYFTLAWLDRYLKGAATTFVRGDEAAQAADGLRRLTATTFDDSIDRSSIGTGRFDLTTGKNLPYIISGDPVADHLSFLYDSSFALDPCGP